MTRRIILGSRSPARLRLLRDAGIEPEVIVSDADETIEPTLSPDEATLTLAWRKADVIVAHLAAEATGRPPSESPLVLTCDSMLFFEGRTYGKPETSSAAVDAWRQRRGRTAVLWTGHVLKDLATGRESAGARPTTVHFAAVTDAEIDAYVATGEPLWVAGAFTLDGRGAPFIDRVDGDHSNVLGLSLPALRGLLGDLDLTIMDLWT